MGHREREKGIWCSRKDRNFSKLDEDITGGGWGCGGEQLFSSLDLKPKCPCLCNKKVEDRNTRIIFAQLCKHGYLPLALALAFEDVFHDHFL